MLSVCSNRVFAEAGPREPKVVIELSHKEHSILLGIATGIALEKAIVRLFSCCCFSSGKCHLVKIMFSCWKNQISVMFWGFFGGWRSSEEGERSSLLLH